MGMRTINGNTFSRIEIRDILISTIVISLAFAIMFRDSSSFTTWFKRSFGDYWFEGLLIMMLALTVVSFVGHEMGHKFTARRYGMWSEYRMFPPGLLLCLVVSFFGVLFAAPGAVMVRSDRITEEQNGKISIAGPLVNMVLSAVGMAGCVLLNGNAAVIAFYLLMSINSALALFNMIPFMPFDGAKIFGWNRIIWLICIAVAALEFFAPMFLLGDLHYV